MLPSLLVLPACMALTTATPLAAEQVPLPEYYAKARILRLLLDYVEWPAGAPNQPLVLGVLEPSPFGEHLPRALDKVIVRQQQQIDALIREITSLRQQAPESGAGISRNLREELPPHF